jgi:hypothetical protein
LERTDGHGQNQAATNGACENEAIFGACMAQELARHAYKIRLEPSNCGSWSGRTWLLKVRKGAANQSDQEWLNRLVESANFEL